MTTLVHPRDLRRALLRGAVFAATWLVVLGVAGAHLSVPRATSVLMAFLLPVPLALVELASVRSALRGRPVDLFLRTWAVALVTIPLVAVEHAYATTVLEGGSLQAAVDRAAKVAAELVTGPAPMVLLVAMAIASLPFALAASAMHRDFPVDASPVGLGLFLVLMTFLLCLGGLGIVAVLVAGALVTFLYRLADRLDHAWLRLRSRPAAAALRERLRAGAITQAQVEVLALLGDPAAATLTNEPRRDPLSLDPWLYQLPPVAGPRLMARAALAAARHALGALPDVPAASAALTAAESALEPRDPDVALAALVGLPEVTDADRAVVAAVRAAAGDRGRSASDAIWLAVRVTGDPEGIAGAVRDAVTVHLAEVW